MTESRIDGAQAHPAWLGDVLKRVMKGAQSGQDFLANFQCPVDRDEAPDCTIDATTLTPTITGPMGFAECPLWRSLECFQYEKIVAATASLEEQHWLKVAPKIGVPRRHLLDRASFATSQPRAAIAPAQAFVHEGVSAGKCLLLIGPNGVGKSWSATCILRELVATKAVAGEIVWWDARDLMRSAADITKRVATLERAKAPALVVFDDVGSEYVAGKDSTNILAMLMAFWDEILCARYENVMATVITSRLMPNEFRDLCTDNVLERIQTTWCQEEHVTGPNLREVRR